MAAFDDADVERLMADAAIVRNRAKILATIANARALTELAGEGGSLSKLIWSHAPERDGAPDSLEQLPPITPESRALAKELKRRGLRFVGPTTAYAAMQACGVVNDHLAGCVVRDQVEAERRAVLETLS